MEEWTEYVAHIADIKTDGSLSEDFLSIELDTRRGVDPIADGEALADSLADETDLPDDVVLREVLSVEEAE